MASSRINTVDPSTGKLLLRPTGKSQKPLVFVGRQAIFDRHEKVFGYELLFRSSLENTARFPDGDQATAQVLVDSLSDLGIETLVGSSKAFINFTRAFLLQETYTLLDPGKVCIEILEDIVPDAELIEAVARLKKAGFTIVLDDFVYDLSFEPLLDLAHIVKLEVNNREPAQIRRQMQNLAGRPLKLLAEKVETRATFELTKELGFHYFQGYFLHEPQVIQGRRLDPDHLAMLELLAKVNAPGVEVEDLEAIISRDVSLSYKILRFINSSSFALRSRIESIQHALMLLGPKALRTWVNLVVLAGVSHRHTELVLSSMLRARMCQEMATLTGLEQHKDACFTAGLFSILDALMGRPMQELVEKLRLSSDLSTALLLGEGPIGPILHSVIAYESCRFEEASRLVSDPIQLQAAFSRALKWVAATRHGGGLAGKSPPT